MGFNKSDYSYRGHNRINLSNELVNEIKEPGAGGLLIIEVKNFKDALNIILEDPLVKNKIVDWKLSEWVDISKE